MKLITILSASIFIIFSSCGPTKKITTPATSLYETKWLLKKIISENGIEDVSTKAFIKFNKENKSAGGNASCNTFGSNAAISNDEVKFTNIFSTKMYCEDVQKIENEFLKQLGKINRFEVTGNSLLLYNDKDVLLEFIAE